MGRHKSSPTALAGSGLDGTQKQCPDLPETRNAVSHAGHERPSILTLYRARAPDPALQTQKLQWCQGSFSRCRGDLDTYILCHLREQEEEDAGARRAKQKRSRYIDDMAAEDRDAEEEDEDEGEVRASARHPPTIR